MADNYTEVLSQLTNHGLLVNDLITGRYIRCRVEGDKEKRGWYILYEITLDNGTPVLVGAYGIWRGADQGTVKVKLGKNYSVSSEEQKQIRDRLAAERKRAANERKHKAKIAALRAEKMWRQLTPDGHADYLTRKRVKAYDVRFTRKNAIALPVRDYSGVIYGLQFILDRVNHKDKIAKWDGRDKHFWPPDIDKKGHFFMFGGIPAGVLLVCEGYATGASLHEATGLPVVVAFDAGNLEPVIAALTQEYPRTGFLICADDDDFGRCLACKEPVIISQNPETCPACGDPHKRTNAGVTAAMKSCLTSRIHWIIPRFPDDEARFAHYKGNKGKLTDFNDLHALTSLNTVRIQVEGAIKRVFPRGLTALAGDNDKGGGGDGTPSVIDTTEELLDRFSYIYGTSGVFDHYKHTIIELKTVAYLCQSREVQRRWMESPHRKVVDPENVGFDPTGKDLKIKCNLWDGWPTEPKEGDCEAVLELIYHMCSGEDEASRLKLFNWFLKWLAFPIQHPGAKMQSALVIHGPQGTGKNTVFEDVMVAIYGKYGRVIDQFTLEDKHNDYLSGKLFFLADEVVARADRYHVKNLLKGLVSGKHIRINPKNLPAREESNHANIVFSSNERMVLVLEGDDRRHLVLWTPPPNPELVRKARLAIKNGGAAALHHYLLNFDLGDFNEGSKPPMTAAKQDLIDLSKDAAIRFYEQWLSGELEVPLVPAKSKNVYELYKIWCGKCGCRPFPDSVVMDLLAHQPGVIKEQRRVLIGSKNKRPTMFFPKGCEENNPGESDSMFLGKCVEIFQDAIIEYRGGAYD